MSEQPTQTDCAIFQRHQVPFYFKTNFLDIKELLQFPQNQEIQAENSCIDTQENSSAEATIAIIPEICAYPERQNHKKEERKLFELEQKQYICQESTKPSKQTARKTKGKQSDKHNFSTILIRKVKELLHSFLKPHLNSKGELLVFTNLSFVYSYFFLQQLKKAQTRLNLRLFLVQSDSEDTKSNILTQFKRYSKEEFAQSQDINNQQVKAWKTGLRQLLISELMETAKNAQVKRKEEFEEYVQEFIELLKKGQVKLKQK